MKRMSNYSQLDNIALLLLSVQRFHQLIDDTEYDFLFI
jgi:hypothetical protein